jgi:predicted RNase H-like HicB family nuclease
MTSKYEIIIFWSDENEAYVADVPELQGCMAHGDTYEKIMNITNDISKNPIERIRHIEILRRINYGHGATSRLQRVFEFTEK